LTNLGFRVLPLKRRPSQHLINEYKTVVTPHISDNLNRMFAMNAYLQPYHKQGKLVGPAITVRTRPGDNLMVHKAIDIAKQGDVIVVDAAGDMTNAIAGEIMLRLAKKKGLSGFVIDGSIRDVMAFREDTFPVYARGVTHRGPYKDGPGEINTPISVGGAIVHPGDLIVGDEDGVVVVPFDEIDHVLQLVKAQQMKEAEIMQAIEEGTIDRSWIDQTLKQKGCDYCGYTPNV